ncbi:MAG: 2Fe-2S iron-sulfur cluster-binding protein [Pseudanabaenaceae cyanobacterium]
MAEGFLATIHHQGQTYTIALDPDRTILESAQAQGLDLPCSCYAGVCTSCAAQIVSGEIDQSQGMEDDLGSKGYALLCIAHAKSDVEIITEKEAEVYALRFGRMG